MICSGVSLSRCSFDRASARAGSAKKRLPPVIPAIVAPPAILRKFRRPKQLQSRGCPSFGRMSDLQFNDWNDIIVGYFRLLEGTREVKSAIYLRIVDVRKGSIASIRPHVGYFRSTPNSLHLDECIISLVCAHRRERIARVGTFPSRR